LLSKKARFVFGVYEFFDGLVYISNIPSYNMNNSVKNGKIESSYNINRPSHGSSIYWYQFKYRRESV